MEGHRDASIRVRRISAEPLGAEAWPSWDRAVVEAPWLDRAHLEHLRSSHPEARTTQSTILRGNHHRWGSMSDYLEEVALDPDAGRVLDDMQDGQASYDDLTSIVHLEIRENGRETTLFEWSRPLVHVATHIVIAADGLDDAEIKRLVNAVPSSIPTMISAATLGLLAAGAPRRIEATIHAALRPGELPPPPWRTRSCRSRTEDLPRGKEND